MSLTAIRTRSGRLVDLANPRVDDIDINDVAWSLARLCRFTGHTSEHYSIAQHSVGVSRVAEPRWGLLHDATEAYLGDVSRPLKLLLPDYRALEDRWLGVVAARFSLALPIPDDVHAADTDICHTEIRRFLSPAHVGGSDRFAISFGWEPHRAFGEFLNRYYELFHV